jgi:hypothetical protein
MGAWAVVLLATACTGGDSTAVESGASSDEGQQATPTTGDASPPVEQSGCEIVTQAGRDVNQALLTDFAELDSARDAVVARLPERASSYASRTADLELPISARRAVQAVQDGLDRLATDVAAATENEPFDAARIQAAVTDVQEAMTESVEVCSESG